MKKLLFILLGISVLTASCDKLKEFEDATYPSEGILTKFDYRRCMCCGGIFIEIENETYRFDKVPEDSELANQDLNFPMKVELNWKKKTESCLGDEILVTKIRKKK